MRDDPCSKYIRAEKSLPENWRVYLWAEHSKGIKLTGSLVRPASPEFEPHLGRDFDWIKPAQGKLSVVISLETYDEIFERKGRK